MFCAVLSCAVLCSFLCCALQCCDLLCRASLCCTALCVACCVVPCCAVPCCAVARYGVLCALLGHAVLCCAVPSARARCRALDRAPARIYSTTNFEELQIEMILRALETLVFADSCSRFAVFNEFRRTLRAFFRNMHFYLQNSLLLIIVFMQTERERCTGCSVPTCGCVSVVFGPSGTPWNH